MPVKVRYVVRMSAYSKRTGNKRAGVCVTGRTPLLLYQPIQKLTCLLLHAIDNGTINSSVLLSKLLAQLLVRLDRGFLGSKIGAERDLLKTGVILVIYSYSSRAKNSRKSYFYLFAEDGFVKLFSRICKSQKREKLQFSEWPIIKVQRSSQGLKIIYLV